ncbi:VanZ family protein [Phytohabitans kaempferiae]|uniref:VanZ family protein n=1 Tax=Phytohabitans kaempferiae TaxID=1620943 RepID=A0ABV6MDT6_9ACTN
MILASVLALPVMAATAVVLAALRRRRGMPVRIAWWRSVAEVGAVAGTLPWIWMILTPREAPRRVHLTPFRDLLAQLSDPGTAVVQIGGNLAVFAALGFFAPIRWPALAGPGRLFVAGAVGSTLVELAQYAFDLGRVSSVDDVLVNAAGATLAGFLSRRWWGEGADRMICVC